MSAIACVCEGGGWDAAGWAISGLVSVVTFLLIVTWGVIFPSMAARAFDRRDRDGAS